MLLGVRLTLKQKQRSSLPLVTQEWQDNVSMTTPLSTRPCYKGVYQKARGLSIYGKGPWTDKLCLITSGRPVEVPEIKAEN